MGLVDGRTVVTTAGTRVQLTGSVACAAVAITALKGNTGTMVVGASTVVAAEGTRRGVALEPGQSISVPAFDAGGIWLDTTHSGDGVSWLTATAD